jgi:F-box domain
MSRRSQRLALQDPALHVLAPLFPELASLVFALLPVDSRLRCREVCRGWRAFLAGVRFWQVCDLGLSSGVARRSPALLRAASERARGTLRELDVSGWYRMGVGEGFVALDDDHLLPVLRANAASLLELRAWKPLDGRARANATAAHIKQLFVAAPRLRLLECDAYLDIWEAQGLVPRLLREPQFAPLRMQTLVIDAIHLQPPVDVPALAAWAAMHPSLKCFMLGGA